MAYMDKKKPYRIVASGKKAERRDYSKVSGKLSNGSRLRELLKFSTKFTRFRTTGAIFV